MGVAIGIDLGTTNSCVAVVQGDQAKVIESVYGDRIHPSVIAFHPSGKTIAGPLAKDRLAIDPLNTVYSFKRLLGQDLNGPEIRALVESLPYDVYEKNGIPVLKTRDREATLPEVSAIMLRYLREMACETYGVDIKDAIITVPANFTDVQRASTKIAGRIAGLNVLRILNEPTAAALAYGFGGDREERIAVYDFGGGTFDITIIELIDDIFEVLSTAGDNFLGGDDLDKKIMDEMLHQFEKKHKMDLHEDPVALQRVRSVAERAKCQLSSIDEVNATLRELVTDRKGNKVDFTFNITRRRFNELVAPLIERTMAVCEEAMALAKLSVGDLDNIVLVGGSTRVPLVRQKVEEFFTEVNPDEVVAIGAAINAFSLTQEPLDPTLTPVRKARVVSDPFASYPPPAPAAPMGTGVGLAAAVRSSKMPPPPARSSLRSLDDPFAAPSAPVGAKADPFARPLTKIGLEPRKGPAMPGVKKEEPISAELPVPVEKEDWDANLPALREDSWNVDLPAPSERNADLPALKASEDDFSALLETSSLAPAPAAGQRSALETGRTLIGRAPVHQGTVDEFGGPPMELDFGGDSAPVGDSIPVGFLPDDDSAPPAPPVPGTHDAGFDHVEFDMSGTPSVPPPPPPAGGVSDKKVEPSRPGAVSPVRPPAPQPVAPDSGFGAIGFPGTGDNGPPPFPVIESESADRADTTMSGPFGNRGFHPLDQVGGKDGREARLEEHAAFTVPVRSASPAVLLDVTPRGLGVATAGGYCDIIIDRNAAIPVEQSRHFSTSRDEQTEVVIEVYQGESRRTSENTLLGRIELTSLRPAPRGEISILVTFEIDTDGILNVKAQNEETKEAHSTTIKLSGGLEDDQVSALLEKYSSK